jgi:hypothetical protein
VAPMLTRTPRPVAIIGGKTLYGFKTRFGLNIWTVRFRGHRRHRRTHRGTCKHARIVSTGEHRCKRRLNLRRNDADNGAAAQRPRNEKERICSELRIWG